MKRLIAVTTCALAVPFMGCQTLQAIPGADQLGIFQDAYQAVNLSDSEVKTMATQFASTSDQQNKIASSGSSYSKRLARLTRGLTREDGLRLNFKVYMDESINAFALADGSVRVHSGMMDVMTDQELLSVIGHEIGHVKMGHSKNALKTAYASSAALKAGRSAVGTTELGQNRLAGLGADAMAKLLHNVVNAQHSQSQEKSADDYGFAFMKRHKYDQRASVTALRKLGSDDSTSSLLASHPDPEDRAERLEKQMK